ncbi:HEAT repeat domain-containing protein [Spirochaeta cellobiosiphila]|uniref:HEAT repeat domain-containing protein n=1 Tax=Spirochaeta cellobiosiphila TaxID=504483 RepID=UPI00041883E0|nr:HEAT repeat domain-containing protein [Spirochaeta cellobiosiphila]
MDLSTIKEYLNSTDTNKIELALDAISDLNPPNAIELIAPFLEHEEGSVRSGAVFNLGELHNPKAIPLIKRYVRIEKDKFHRGFGIQALSNFIMLDNLFFLGEVLQEDESMKNKNQFIKMNIADQLGDYSKYEYALELLEILLKDENPKVRTHAVDALVKFDCKKAKKLWVEIVKQENQNQYIIDLAKSQLNDVI